MIWGGTQRHPLKDDCSSLNKEQETEEMCVPSLG